MKNIIWISYAFIFIAFFCVISCRSISRDIDKEKYLQKEISKSETNIESEKSTSSETQENTSTKFDLTQLSITPVNGLADFSFNYNGKLISGHTSGVLNFSNEKKEVEEKLITKTITKEKWKIWTKTYKYTFTKTYKFYKSVTKTVVYTWWFWVVLIAGTVVGWELLKKLWRLFIKSNFYLNIINQLMRKR